MNLKILLQKVAGRSLRLLSKIVPYNTRYKPVGIIDVSKGTSVDGIAFIELSPPVKVTLNLREQFIEDCSSYAKPINEIQYPGDFILNIPHGRIYAYDASNMAVISRSNNIIEQVSFQWANDKILGAGDNILFKQKFFSAPKEYRGNVFCMLAGGGAINYYYHWLFDAMPKLALLKGAQLFEKTDYFLVPNYAFSYQKQYLNYFGIPASKIINGEQVKHLQCDNLYVASAVRVHDHHPKQMLEFLYSSLIHEKNTRAQKKRIYIARGDAEVNRKVINESELIDRLRKYNFEIHYLSGLTIIQQAKLFNEAQVVVGAHGAGLSNLVFCEAGTQVLEIFPDQYVRHLFYDVCNKRGIAYEYLLCPSEGLASNSVEGQKISLIADVDAIESKVKSLLKGN
jgi:hypothetical protein